MSKRNQKRKRRLENHPQKQETRKSLSWPNDKKFVLNRNKKVNAQDDKFKKNNQKKQKSYKSKWSICEWRRTDGGGQVDVCNTENKIIRRRERIIDQ